MMFESALKRSSLLFIVLLFVVSCNSEEVVTVIDTLPSGTLQGSVFLTSNDTSTYPLDGVVVSLEGTMLSAVTDRYGKWKIHNVPTRTYNITFEKEGFGDTRIFSFGFLGGVPITVPNQILYKRPDCAPIFDNVILFDTTQFQLNAHLPCGKTISNHYVAFFLSNNKDVSCESGKHALGVIGGASGTNPASAVLSPIYFQPGYPYADSKLDLYDSIYAVAYSMGGYSVQVNPVTGESYYPSLRPEASRRLAFKLPFKR